MALLGFIKSFYVELDLPSFIGLYRFISLIPSLYLVFNDFYVDFTGSQL